MPWQTQTPMSQRLEFIEALVAGRRPMRALCKEFGIAEKTGHKWRNRFLAGGPAALTDRSHAPVVPPHQVPRAQQAVLVALREAHPTWGARKLRAYLQRQEPATAWPAPSTITTLLKRAGLIAVRRRRDPAASRWATAHLTVPTGPNEVWATDFKGEFKMRPGPYCYPLTVSDLHSRYLLGCEALGSTASAPVRVAFQQLFQRYGLPRVIRSDNGVPFASPAALGGLSTLSVWWIRLGIRPERTTKGKPTENGTHERMHRTLKAEAAHPEASLAEQQRRFTAWQTEYNELRPHEALGQTPPRAHYHASDRPYPKRLPVLEYAPHLLLRRVTGDGFIRHRGIRISLSLTLAGEYVALEEHPDDRWQIRFGPLQLGHWVAIDDTFEPDVQWLPTLS
jgi:putative transposase